MRLHTAKKRRKRKLFGPQLSKPDVRRLAMLNRYAAAKDREIGARARIYGLKDFILRRYGRPAGYTLQHWTSYGYYDGPGEDDGAPDACCHWHILKRIRLGEKVFHCPTGHFRFVNWLNGYEKKSPGFEDWKQKCKDRFEGKKVVTANVPTRQEVADAYRKLMKRLRYQINKEAGK